MPSTVRWRARASCGRCENEAVLHARGFAWRWPWRRRLAGAQAPRRRGPSTFAASVQLLSSPSPGRGRRAVGSLRGLADVGAGLGGTLSGYLAPRSATRKPALSGVGTPCHAKMSLRELRTPSGRRRDPRHPDARGGAIRLRPHVKAHKCTALTSATPAPRPHRTAWQRRGWATTCSSPTRYSTRRGWARSPTSHASPSRWTRRRRSTRRCAARSARC